MTRPPQRATRVPMSDTSAAPDTNAHAWARGGDTRSPPPDCALPTWTGGGVTLHRHLLVIGSTHDGDLVSQLRYLEAASARFAKVGFVGPANVRRLVEWSMGERVVVISRMPRDVSDWDLHCPIGALARALGPQAASTQASRPHLRVTTPAAQMSHPEPRDAARFGTTGMGDKQRCGLPWPCDHRPDSVDAAAKALIAMATEFQRWTR